MGWGSASGGGVEGGGRAEAMSRPGGAAVGDCPGNGEGRWSGFAAAAAALGLDVGPQQAALLDRYAAELERFGGAFNLGARRGGAVAPEEHFIWSLGVFAAYRPAVGERIVDIGSGAGFPGLVVRVVRADLDLCLIEANRKRALFLENATRVLGWTGVEVICGRAEEVGRRLDRRGAFDLALARAFGPFEVVCELALPLLRVGGRLMAYRGPRGAEEVATAREHVAAMGGRVSGAIPWRPPEGAYAGATPLTMVTISKEDETPERYPRTAARLGRWG